MATIVFSAEQAFCCLEILFLSCELDFAESASLVLGAELSSA